MHLFANDRNLSGNVEINNVHAAAFKIHFDTLYNYGIRVTNDGELVKDCIQELFYRMWKNNIDLSTIDYPKSYLIKALRNQLLNVLSLKYHQMKSVEVDNNISVDFSPEDYFIQAQYEEELRLKVINALQQLSKKQREAVYLRYFENLEYSEIAEIMNINLQSSKNNVHRGLVALKDLLGGQVTALYILKGILFFN